MYKKILCKIGLHEWIYKEGFYDKTCKRCKISLKFKHYIGWRRVK